MMCMLWRSMQRLWQALLRYPPKHPVVPLCTMACLSFSALQRLCGWLSDELLRMHIRPASCDKYKAISGRTWASILLMPCIRRADLVALKTTGERGSTYGCCLIAVCLQVKNGLPAAAAPGPAQIEGSSDPCATVLSIPKASRRLHNLLVQYSIMRDTGQLHQQELELKSSLHDRYLPASRQEITLAKHVSCHVQVAIMFLSKAELFHESSWALWFQHAAGLLPVSVLRDKAGKAHSLCQLHEPRDSAYGHAHCFQDVSEPKSHDKETAALFLRMHIRVTQNLLT